MTAGYDGSEGGVALGAREALGAQLPQFYAGRSILITGATGFMGKVLVERLLATCGDVRRLHLLVRHKKAHTPRQRLQHLSSSQVLDGVRARSPAQLDKLCVVEGDVTQPALGLDEDARQHLAEVSVVFHCAATVKFDEPLGAAVRQNVHSIINVMDLCDTLPNLQVLVYVSTAYSNAELCAVEERVYPPPLPLEQVLALATHVPEPLLQQLTHKLIAPKPNTYTFSKALAETAVQQRVARACRYAVAIFRPTIVVSSLKHPYPGWIDNLNGPSGVVVGTGRGVLHAFPCDLAARADLLPVDIAIDTMLAVAWDTALDRRSEVRVYNCSTGENPVTWRQFRDEMVRAVRRHPFTNALWYPFLTASTSPWLLWLMVLMLQRGPLLLAALVPRLLGLSTSVKLETVSRRLGAMTSVLEFFALRSWCFRSDNVARLRTRLTTADRDIYNLDPKSIVWEQHLSDFVLGVRKYLLQENDDNAEASLRLHRLRVIHAVARACAWLVAARLLLAAYNLLLT